MNLSSYRVEGGVDDDEQEVVVDLLALTLTFTLRHRPPRSRVPPPYHYSEMWDYSSIILI
jgi:hypothetical protein